MKVLLFYKDAAHAQPFLAVRGELQKRGIEVDAYNTRSHEDCRRELHRKADLLIVYSQLMDSAITWDGPILMVDRIDGAQLAQARPWMDHPNVRGVLKGYRFLDPQINNQHSGRHSAWLLAKTGIKPNKKSMVSSGKPTPISDAGLSQIRLMYGFGGHPHLNGALRLDGGIDDTRQFDVHYVATISYSGSEIETHRRLALKELKAYNGPKVVGGDTRMRHDKFLAAMARSRVAVSPWGCGESCHRDYEAWVLGAVLVKPNSDYVDCWPPHYIAEQTYLTCRMDFKDLPEVVQRVRNYWDTYWEMRHNCRDVVLRCRRQEFIADRLAAEIWKAYNR